MDTFTTEGKEAMKIIPYDEKIKDKTLKNEITKRWRNLGLLDGIQPNSKTEKLIIEMYERMAIYLLSEGKTNICFNTMIFPFIRLLYTGEKCTGKKINFIVKPEELIQTLSSITMDIIKPIFEKNVPKSAFNRLQPLFNLIEYKNLNKKTLLVLEENDLLLSPEEKSLLTALLPNQSMTQFDFEAEILALVNASCVFVLKEAKKQRKTNKQ
jgi:hypothetical protein